MTLIDKSIDISVYHMFKNNKSVLTAKTLTDLKKEIKEHVKPPSKNVKVFVMDFYLSKENENKNENKKIDRSFTIICGQYTVTPKLGLVMTDDDHAQTISYTKEEFNKYGFKKSHIIKIIKAFQNDLISYENSNMPITDVLKATE
jgi:hypothetical protein